MIRYPVKENHINTEVSEILRNKQKDKQTHRQTEREPVTFIKGRYMYLVILGCWEGTGACLCLWELPLFRALKLTASNGPKVWSLPMEGPAAVEPVLSGKNPWTGREVGCCGCCWLPLLIVSLIWLNRVEVKGSLGCAVCCTYIIITSIKFGSIF